MCCEPADVVGDGFSADSASGGVQECDFLVAIFLKHNPFVKKDLGRFHGASPIAAGRTER